MLAPVDSIKTLLFGSLKPSPGRSKSLAPSDVAAIFKTFVRQRRIEHLRIPREMFLKLAIGALVESADFSRSVCARCAAR